MAARFVSCADARGPSKRFDLDDDMARHRLRVREIRVDQTAAAAGLRIQWTRKWRIAAATSSACVSSAKWPVSKKRTTAPGMSRLNASAPGGRKNGSFLPQTARSGGWDFRK